MTTLAQAVGSLAVIVFVKVTMLVLLAVVAMTLLRSMSAATRSACWTALGIALLALPAIAGLVPRFSVPVPAITAAREWIAPEAASPQPATVLGARDQTKVSLDAATDAGGPEELRGTRVIHWIPATVGLVWLIGFGLLVSGLVRGLARVRAIRLQATPIDEESVASELRALAEQLGVRRRVRLYASQAVDVPVTGGLVRPFIILPDEYSDWTGRRWRAATLHELAHVARWDFAAHLLFEIVRAVYWPNPLVWRAMSRATTERERAADDRVILAGTNAADYAAELLSFAAATLDASAARAVMGLAPSGFRTRMRAILQADVNRGLATRRHVAAIGVVATVGLSAVAAVSAGHTGRATPNVGPMQRALGPNDEVAITPRAGRSHFASLGDVRLDSLLTVLLRDSVPKLRVTAARALRADGAETSVVRVLVSALSDSCHGDRWRATRALRDLRDGRALPGLVHRLVADEHPAVRSMAANAIATSGAFEGATLLRAALTGARGEQFDRVARAIDTLGESFAAERLLTALRDARTVIPSEARNRNRPGRGVPLSGR